MHKRTGRTLILSAVIMLIPLLGWSNTKKEFWESAPESVYDRYQEAASSYDQEWVLSFADSLDALGQKEGRKEYEFFASVLRCHHAFNLRDSSGFFMYSEDARDLAEKFGWYEDYFAEMMNAVAFHLNARDYFKSQKMAQQLLEEAGEHENRRGTFYGHYALGAIHSERGEWNISNSHFLKAIEYAEPADDGEDSDRAQLYSRIASNYLNAKEYEKAKEYASLALLKSNGEDDALAYRALAEFRTGDYDGFAKDVKDYRSREEESTSISYDYYILWFNVLEAAQARKIDEAIAYCEDFSEEYDKYEALAEVYRINGDWKNAYKYEELYSDLISSQHNETFSDELARLEAEMDLLAKTNREKENILRSRFIHILEVLGLLAIIAIVAIDLIRKGEVKRARKNELLVANTYRTLVENAPFSYSKARLIYNEDHSVKDYITVETNKTVKESVKAAGAKVGELTIVEAYPQSGPFIVAKINEAIVNNQQYIRFSLHLKEFHRYYETIILLDGSDYIQTISLNTTDLVTARKNAEKANMAKTQFIQNMSHEIRTPLNAVVGFSQLLSMPGDNLTEEEKAEYSSYITNNANMLVMLIDDILDASDSENGNYKIILAEAPCNEICRSAIKSAESRIPAGVEMKFTTEVDDSFTFETDARRVQQVLVNYLTNACKHTTKGSIHLHCSTTEVPGKITFSVADTGTGVPPEMAEDIFKRFTKLNAFKQGAGLGLNICSTIAEKLGGTVKLDTSYKDGARFIFSL